MAEEPAEGGEPGMAGLIGERGLVAGRHALGREGVPLVIVDDAHPAPDALVATARAQRFARTSEDVYPGVRSVAPDAYATWLVAFVAAAWPRDGLALLRTSFAIASDGEAGLAPIQRLPHVDTEDDRIVAAVHYLCGPAYGGTGFYRHRRTGYERIDRSRRASWRQALARDLALSAMDGRPAGGSGFERIGGVAVRFNRLILYPANCLHSGELGDTGPQPSADIGRLTVTSLLA